MVLAKKGENVCMQDEPVFPNIELNMRNILLENEQQAQLRCETALHWLMLSESVLYSKTPRRKKLKTKYLTCIFFWSPYPSITCYETHSLIHKRYHMAAQGRYEI